MKAISNQDLTSQGKSRYSKIAALTKNDVIFLVRLSEEDKS